MLGPLHGYRVIELAGLGAAPFAGMLLADLGAEVIRVDRPTAKATGDGFGADPCGRGKRSLGIDLRHPEGRDVVLRLARTADIFIESFRPGVAERLGVGPAECRERNPRLVYGRLTGWGQEGPYAQMAGHDINYLGVAGVLAHIGRHDALPVPPLNLLGDMASGGMLLVIGVLSAAIEAGRTGVGQVIDAAMIDGAALLMASIYGLRARGRWNDEHGTNLLDSGAPFYDVYETADRELIAVGALERRFFDVLADVLELPPGTAEGRFDPSRWPELRQTLRRAFATRTLAQWQSLFDGKDACVSPVRDMKTAAADAHLANRSTILTVNGVEQPAPAPRFSRHEPRPPDPAPRAVGEHTRPVLRAAGFQPAEIDALITAGTVVAE